MKKIAAIAMVLAMTTAVLAGCGTENTGTGTASDAAASSTAAEQGNSSGQAADTGA